MSILVPTQSMLGSSGGLMASRVLVTDPLAGLPFFGRWQTHVPGSNALMGNLFQDTALTIPAALAGEFVNGIEGAMGVTGNMIQGDGLTQEVLGFDSGIPYIGFPGDGYYNLPSQASLSEGELFMLAMHTTASGGQTIYSLAASIADDVNSYIPNGIGGQIFDSFGTTIRKNGIANSISQNTWFIYNSSSKNGEWRNAVDGVELFSTASNTSGFASSPIFGTSSTGSRWPGGRLIALFIFSQVLTAPQRDLVNSYLESLKP
jgi:hypothetical protein